MLHVEQSNSVVRGNEQHEYTFLSDCSSSVSIDTDDETLIGDKEEIIFEETEEFFSESDIEICVCESFNSNNNTQNKETKSLFLSDSTDSEEIDTEIYYQQDAVQKIIIKKPAIATAVFKTSRKTEIEAYDENETASYEYSSDYSEEDSTDYPLGIMQTTESYSGTYCTESSVAPTEGIPFFFGGSE